MLTECWLRATVVGIRIEVRAHMAGTGSGQVEVGGSKEKDCCHCHLVAKLCLTLCDPMDCSPSGSSVHGILQARILEWVAISFSRGSSQQSPSVVILEPKK